MFYFYYFIFLFVDMIFIQSLLAYRIENSEINFKTKDSTDKQTVTKTSKK
jgi:hypothetical protein